MLLRAIILDRDGVINEDSDEFIKSVAEFRPISGSLDAIAAFKKRGLIVAIASNQSGLARGLFSLQTLDAMHAYLHKLLAEKGTQLDYIAICQHGPDDHCACRKPKPGLLIEICQHLNLKPEECLFVGDSFRDYEAAKAINMPFILVKTGKGMRTLEKHTELAQEISIYKDLQALANSP